MSNALRVCKICKLEAYSTKDLEKFKSHPASKYGRKLICKQCHSIQLTKHRKENRDKVNAYNKAKGRTNKIKGILLKGGKCEHCGLSYNTTNATIFDFHHVKPLDKEFRMGGVVISSLKRFLKELEKCILLCSNCHRLVHNDKY